MILAAAGLSPVNTVQCTIAPDPVNDVGISLTITQFMCIFAYILEEGGRFVI